MKQTHCPHAGIDRISFYTPAYCLPLTTLAKQRDVDSNKYVVGLGQETMSVPPPDEDAVTMAANAAYPLIQQCNKQDIGLLLFATESSVDQSKAAGLFVHGLLNLPSQCQVVELKQACYGGVAALRFAWLWAQSNPNKKALVLASDIARYELKSPGEPTQGCGAVALLVSANPQLLALDSQSGLYAQDVMDFWRPNHRQEPVFDGKYSAKMYLCAALQCWQQYAQQTGRSLHDMARVCYHLPFTNMACKAHGYLMNHVTGQKPSETQMLQHIAETLHYNRLTGNTYTASLFEGLASLLDTCKQDLSDQRIGLFGYGSGCMGEFFSGVIQPNYSKHLLRQRHKNLLHNRTQLSFAQYETWFAAYTLHNGQNSQNHVFERSQAAAENPFRLAKLQHHKRIYEYNEPAEKPLAARCTTSTKQLEINP